MAQPATTGNVVALHPAAPVPARAHSAGPKADGQYLSAAALAKLVRADIRAAVKAGDLPAHLTYSVTSEHSTLHSSVYVTVRGATDAWLYANPAAPERDRQPSAAADALHNKVEAIRAAYNWDASDSMTDYFDTRYYGSVTLEDDAARGFRLQRAAERSAMAVWNKAVRAGADLVAEPGTKVIRGRTVRAAYRVVDGDGATVGRVHAVPVRYRATGLERLAYLAHTPAGTVVYESAYAAAGRLLADTTAAQR